MELVTILLTIILVGTVATFVLAVLAYVLHKIRDRRSREDERQSEIASRHRYGKREPLGAAPTEPGKAATATSESDSPVASAWPEAERPDPSTLFWEYTTEGFVPIDPSRPSSPDEDADTGAWR